MRPLVSEEARYTPKNAQRFNSSCGLYPAHVFSFITKCRKNIRHHFFCSIIVATNEHGGLAARKFRFIHYSISHTTKCLDKFGGWYEVLQMFHQRFIKA